MGKLIAILLAAVFLAGAYVYVTPHLAVKNLTRALENEDPIAVERYVDFESVRDSFRTDFAESMNIDTGPENSFAAAFALSIADGIVRNIVSADTMVIILKDKPRRDRMGFTDDLGALLSNGSWHGIHDFVLRNAEGRPTALLTRDGLSWRVSALRIQ